MKGLQIESKRLKSGNFQVKFNIYEGNGKSKKGYILVSPGITLKEVVSGIRDSIDQGMVSTMDVNQKESGFNIFYMN